MRQTIGVISLVLLAFACSRDSQMRVPSSSGKAKTDENGGNAIPLPDTDRSADAGAVDAADPETDGAAIISDDTDLSDWSGDSGDTDSSDAGDGDSGDADTTGSGEGDAGDLDGEGDVGDLDGEGDVGDLDDAGGDDLGLDDGWDTSDPDPTPTPQPVTPWRTLLRKVYRHNISWHQFGLPRDNYYSKSADPLVRPDVLSYKRASMAFEVFERAPTAAEFPDCAPREILRCLSGSMNRAEFNHHLAFSCGQGFDVAEKIGFVCTKAGANRTRLLQHRDPISWTHKQAKRNHAVYVIGRESLGAPWEVVSPVFFAPER